MTFSSAVVKAAGTYYPLSAFSSEGGPPTVSTPSSSSSCSSAPTPTRVAARPPPPAPQVSPQQLQCRVRTDLQPPRAAGGSPPPAFPPPNPLRCCYFFCLSVLVVCSHNTACFLTLWYTQAQALTLITTNHMLPLFNTRECFNLTYFFFSYSPYLQWSQLTCLLAAEDTCMAAQQILTLVHVCAGPRVTTCHLNLCCRSGEHGAGPGPGTQPSRRAHPTRVDGGGATCSLWA